MIVRLLVTLVFLCLPVLRFCPPSWCVVGGHEYDTTKLPDVVVVYDDFPPHPGCLTQVPKIDADTCRLPGEWQQRGGTK